MPNDDALVTDIADAIRQQYEYITHSPLENQDLYTTQLRDETVSIASVIVKHFPEYDIETFYTRSGYEGGHPMAFPFGGYSYETGTG